MSKNLSRALFSCQVLPYDFKKYFSAELVVRAKLKFHQILLPVFLKNCPGVFDSIWLIKETEEKSENYEQICFVRQIASEIIINCAFLILAASLFSKLLWKVLLL